MVTSFFDQLEQSFKKTMNQSERAQEAPKTPLEHHFTLEDCNESQQTIAERPKDCPIPAESASTAPQDPRLFMDVADSLAQLKSTVTDLIDRTIVDIESKASLSQNVSCETVLMKRALGEGGENSVQNSESYAQSKKAIRSKLYGEIEEIVKRLKDMEFLEWDLRWFYILEEFCFINMFNKLFLNFVLQNIVQSRLDCPNVE